MEMNSKTKKVAMIVQIVFNSIIILILGSLIFDIGVSFIKDMENNIIFGAVIILLIAIVIRLISRMVLAFKNLRLLKDGNDDILMEDDLDEKHPIAKIDHSTNNIILVIFIIIVLGSVISLDYGIITNWDGSNNSLYTLSVSMLFVIACIYIIIRRIRKK